MNKRESSDLETRPLMFLERSDRGREVGVNRAGGGFESDVAQRPLQRDLSVNIRGSRKASTDTYAWLTEFRFVIAVLDLIAIAFAIILTGFIRFGESPMRTVSGSALSYPVTGVLIGVAWWVALTANESRGREILGVGPEEYRRVIKASLYTFGFIAVLSYLAAAQLSRLFFIGLLPVGVLALLAVRFLCRSILTAKRRSGEALVPTLVVGSIEEVHGAVSDMDRHPQAGFRPAALCVTDPSGLANPENPLDLPFVAFERITEEVSARHLGAVVIAGGLSRGATRRLAWALESSRVQLMVIPRMIDVAGPRLRYSTVDGLNLTHVDLPRYSGLHFWMKRTFDVGFASLALLLISPVLLAVAIAIKLDDGGPVLFRQQRVGRGGQPFTIHKFRTMCQDAESKVAALIEETGGSALLFKIENDPRVTKVGRILRKFSLDELPQFWTVLMGDMSIVGPRPQVDREVAEYTPAAHRRLLIKPGITGLWQVSGRSELSLEESIRIDLRYVENWSLTGDITIILRTIKVVLFPSGAY